LALALFFEAVPFGLAIANGRHVDDGTDDDDSDGYDADQQTQNNTPASSALVLSPYEVEPGIPEPEATSIDAFARKLRLLSLALATNMADVMKNESKLEPSKHLFMDLSRLPLKRGLRDEIAASVQTAAGTRIAEAKRFGRSEQDLEEITVNCFEVLKKLYAYEDEQLESLAAAWHHSNAVAREGF
jgi:hypothetical protein